MRLAGVVFGNSYYESEIDYKRTHLDNLKETDILAIFFRILSINFQFRFQLIALDKKG